MLKKLWSFALAACLSIGVAQAAVIGFEGGADPTFTYSDVTFSSTPIGSVSGYNNVAAFTGSSWIAYNPFEVSPSSFFLAGDPSDTFTLNSFVIAGAWGTQTLLVEGLNDGAVLFSSNVGITLDPIVFMANWGGIDQLRIWVGSDFVQASNVSGAGKHWALDNLTINDVPEPGSLALLAIGLAGVGALRRRGKTAA